MFGRKRRQQARRKEENWAMETITIIKHKLLEDPPFRDVQIGLIDDEGREVLRLDVPTERCGDLMIIVAPVQELHVSVLAESLVCFPDNVDRRKVLETINEFNRKLVHMTFVLVDDIEGMPPFLRMKTTFMCDAPNRTADQAIFMISMLPEYLEEAYTTFSAIAKGVSR